MDADLVEQADIDYNRGKKKRNKAKFRAIIE